MATLIAYWKGSTGRRLLKVFVGAVACLLPVVWLSLNPTVAVRILEWGLSGSRSNRHQSTAVAAENAPPELNSSSTSASHTAPVQTASVERPQQPAATSGVLPSAIAASIGATRIAGRPDVNTSPTTGNADDQNREILQRVCNLLKSGRVRFGQIPAYSATFIKRERIGAEVTDPTTMELKVRHQPFAVYLKWLEGPGLGREILYPDGADDGSMLVRMGGLKGRLIPAFKIDAGGALAMNQARYPVGKAGILGLAESLIAHREGELQNHVYARARQTADAEVDGRRCAAYLFEFDDRERSPDYRKSIQYLDRDWNVPLHVENYGWPEPGQHLEGAALDEVTLIEYYKYSNIVTNGLTDDDFSPSNPEYRFRR
jgi:hypothetical protein